MGLLRDNIRHDKGAVCAAPECHRPTTCKQWCHTHYYQDRRGIPIHEMGDLRQMCKKGVGGINSQGYHVQHRDGKGRVLTHRHIIEEHIDRQLLSSENVHHINGDRLDNRLENLEIWNTSQPAGQRPIDKVRWALEILELYGQDVLDG